jgi:hypothetical protein
MLRNAYPVLAAALFALVLPGIAPAQNQTQDQDALAQANNPLAQVTAFNVQAYVIDELTDINKGASQLLFRFAKPFSVGKTNWLMRATMPVNHFPVGQSLSHRTGPGDFDVFAAYLIDTGKPGRTFGVGPQLVMPTASPQELGNEQWQLGVANVLFDASSPTYQWGYLAIYRVGVGETNGRERVSQFAFQPFSFIQLGGGWYTGAAPIWTYDFESNNYSLPMGIRFGRAFKSGSTVFNIFAEPQVSLIDSGPGLPEQQIFLGVNMQF